MDKNSLFSKFYSVGIKYYLKWSFKTLLGREKSQGLHPYLPFLAIFKEIN